MGEKRARAFVRGVEHDSGGAEVRRRGNGVEVWQLVGEQYDDERHAQCHGAKRIEAVPRIAIGEQPELHVVDAAGGLLQHCIADGFRVHRQIADGGAYGHAASNERHDAACGFPVERANGAPPRLLQVDDFGAGKECDRSFGLVAHAGKEEGHLRESRVMPAKADIQ